jgi:DNA polymerase-3 subunit epsilon
MPPQYGIYPIACFFHSFSLLFPSMSWTTATIHVLDFEGGRRSGVVEYGVATLTGGKVADVSTRLCAATGPLTAGETALHGIHAGDLSAAAPFAAEQARFAQLRQTGPLAAHHAPIERALLRRAWPVPPAAPDFSAPDPATAPRLADWGPWLDTRRIYEKLYPALPSYQLMELVRAFALEKELSALAAAHCPPKRRQPHCALFDALAAALLLARLAREPALANASLPWLLMQSVSPEDGETMRQNQLPLAE